MILTTTAPALRSRTRFYFGGLGILDPILATLSILEYWPIVLGTLEVKVRDKFPTAGPR